MIGFAVTQSFTPCVRQTFITMKRYLWPYIQFSYDNYANYITVITVKVG